MKKSKAYLNLSRSSVNKVIEKGEIIITKMSGNADFPDPNPKLSDVQAQCDLVARKIAEQGAAFLLYQQKTMEINTEKDNLISLLETEGNYVEFAANGDEIKILGAGYEVKKAPTPIGQVGAPKNVSTKEGKGAGVLVIAWASIKGAKAYNVEQSNDITKPDAWMHIQTVTKAKCEVHDLVSGDRIWFRVSAIVAAGEGPYSDVTNRIVP